MPVPFFLNLITDGFESTPHSRTIFRTIVAIAVLYIIKRYFQGAANLSERNMHGKVIIVTVRLLPSMLLLVRC